MSTPSAVLELDPETIAQRKKKANYRLNVIQVPVLRFLGFALISSFILVHNYYVFNDFSWLPFVNFTSIALAYTVFSSAVLYLFYGDAEKFDLGLFFLTMDIFVFVLAIYFSGGYQSLLFFLLLIRVADQTNTTFRRVLLFAHVSIIAYIIMLFYIAWVDRRPIPLSLEIPKLGCIYFAALYISLTARTAERLRNRTTAAMRLARKSILDIKAKSRELEEAKVKADAGNIAKSQFLANINHEIRTPLNGIIGMTSLVMDTPLNREQKEYLEMVKRSADSLLNILSTILDFSEAESREVAIVRGPFDLRSVLNDIVDSLSPDAGDKGIEIDLELEADVPDTLVGDASRLYQILEKLGGNAVKFSEMGRVSIRVSVEEKPEDHFVLLHFMISDTGVGIAPDKIEGIFDGFTQVDGSSTRKYGGTGLGLALSKRLVDIMGGRIWVESPWDSEPEDRLAFWQRNNESEDHDSGKTRGPGSCFHLILPFAVAGRAGSALETHAGGAAAEASFDFSKAIEVVGGNIELLREIAALFVEDTSDKLARLRSALQTSDSGGVETTAQSLKGAAANIGAKTIEAVSVQLETIAREGRLNDASTVLNDLENAVEAFNDALKERNIYLER